MILRQTLDHLNSACFLKFTLLCWAILAVGSIGYLSAGYDDVFYLQQIVNFVRDFSISISSGDISYSVYGPLPGYPFFQGLYFWLLDLVGIELNSYTYRLYQITLLILIPLLVVQFFKKATPAHYRLGASLFLVFLGVMPYVLHVVYIRPEGTGLLFSTLALVLFTDKDGRITAQRCFLAALCLGIAATMHPTFTVIIGLACVLLLIRLVLDKAYKEIIVGLLGVALPLLIMVLWYQAGAPLSWDIFFSTVDGRAGRFNPTILIMFETAVKFLWQPNIGNIYFGFFFLWMSFFTVVGVLLLLRKIRSLFTLPMLPYMTAALFIGTVFNLCYVPDGRIQTISASSFYVLLEVVILLSPCLYNRYLAPKAATAEV